jgi:hypothetical protein
MRIEKEPRKVILLCREGVLLTGNVHKNISERVKDFLNDPKEKFFALTDVQVLSSGQRGSIHALAKGKTRVGALLINKEAVVFVEDL